DLYLRIFITEKVRQFTKHELQTLRDIWASFPVTNPNNQTGIDLHIVDQMKIDNLRYHYEKPLSKNYNYFLPEAQQCIYYAVFVTNIPDYEDFAAKGEIGGLASIIDGQMNLRVDRTYPHRVITVTHELLHNVVGHLDTIQSGGGTIHTNAGWLSQEDVMNIELQLSQPVINDLNQNGFARESVSNGCA
ncbi:MAG: hypothetical protein ABEI86_01135, partial [Halobacteriaceae archaeon]